MEPIRATDLKLESVLKLENNEKVQQVDGEVY
jgi:hypothetical protein